MARMTPEEERVHAHTTGLKIVRALKMDGTPAIQQRHMEDARDLALLVLLLLSRTRQLNAIAEHLVKCKNTNQLYAVFVEATSTLLEMLEKAHGATQADILESVCWLKLICTTHLLKALPLPPAHYRAYERWERAYQYPQCDAPARVSARA